MDCDDAMLVLAARGQRALSGNEKSGLASHLEGCEPCRELASQVDTSRELAVGDTLALGSSPGGGLVAAISTGASELVRGDAIGRFLVLELLGKGGMGVVYLAYDPDLDRRVAIKLLRAHTSADHRARLLREAQAMARIKHPHVITVHEVGTHDEQVYIAMELADGGTLRAWCGAAERSVREVLAVFVRAGGGLAAAHAAGLVHRDFKPDNVLLSKDGGVLVTDFGLVSTLGDAVPDRDDLTTPSTPLSDDLTRTGAIMGTPAYMAPEQFKGTSSARSDQFAFCVALYEAIYGVRPFAGVTYLEIQAAVSSGEIAEPKDRDVPGWLRRALLRGLATDPAARHPSMAELLAVLEGTPLRRRRILALGAGGLAAAGIAVAVVSLRSGPAAETCTGGAERTAGVWNDARRSAMSSAFAATKRPHAAASFDRSAASIDAWLRDWEGAFVEACRASEREEQSPLLLDRRMDCLARRLDGTRATIDALIAGGVDAVDRAVDATRSLPTVAPCADAIGLLAAIAPPDSPALAAQVAEIRKGLGDARGTLDLGRFVAARDLARPALERARAVSYPPVLAEALLMAGVAEFSLAERSGVTTLEAAMRVATEAGDGAVAVESAGWLTSALIDAGRFEAAESVAIFGEATAVRVRPPVEVEVRLRTTIGALHQLRHRPDAAREYLDRALALAEKHLGPDHPLTLSVVDQQGQLAKSRGRFAEARALLERAVASQKRTAGEDHPTYARSLAKLGDIYRAEAKLDDARRVYDRALAIRQALLGPDHPDVGQSHNSIGSLLLERGDNAAALASYRKALAIFESAHGPDNVENVPMVMNIGLALANLGDRKGARAHYERGLALLERTHGADHPSLVNGLTNLGALSADEHRYADALALHVRALRITERVYGPAHPDVADSLANIGVVYKHLGRLEEAEEWTVRALRATEKAYGAEHTRAAMSHSNLGDVQVVRKRDPDALVSFRRATAIFEARLGKQHPYISITLGAEGDALIRLGRAAEAVPILERAVAIRTAAQMEIQEVAEMRWSLARALGAIPAQRARARGEAEAVLAVYVKANKAEEASAIRTWLAALP